jgi:hypothetical protein
MAESERPLSELVEEYRRTRKTANLVRTLIPLGIILIFVIFALIAYGRFKSFDTEAFTDQVADRASKLLPRVSDALVEVGSEVVPAFATEFEKQLDGSMERISAVVDKELTLLQQNLTAHLEKSLTEFATGAANSHRDLVVKEFPQFANDQVKIFEITSAVDGAFEKWFFDQINGMFSRHIRALASIQETASKLRNQAVKDGQKSVTGEEVLGLWLEVINEKFEVEPGDGATTKARR